MSFIDRREFLLESLGNSYAKQIKNQSVLKNSQIFSEIDVNCGTSFCKKCLQTFCTDPDNKCCSDGFTYDFSESACFANKNNIPPKKVKRPSPCFGLCSCVISNIDMNTSILWDTTKQINSNDIQSAMNQIIKEVKQNMTNKYGETNTKNDYDKVITNIVTQLNNRNDQIIQQMLSSSQIIKIKGAGVTLNKINMDITINAIMKAISDICSSETLCGINSIIQEDMDIIQKKVTKNVQSSFSFVWQKIKNYALLALIFFIVTITLYVFLLIFKALRSKKEKA
jgi:hypothetical protein